MVSAKTSRKYSGGVLRGSIVVGRKRRRDAAGGYLDCQGEKAEKRPSWDGSLGRTEVDVVGGVDLGKWLMRRGGQEERRGCDAMRCRSEIRVRRCQRAVSDGDVMGCILWRR